MSFQFNLANLFDSGAGEGGSEVVAYEAGRAYVTNGEQDRIDVFQTTDNGLVFSIDLSGIENFDGVQSVAVNDGVVAAAVAREAGTPDVDNMITGLGGWTADNLFTVGATLDNGYTPPGIMDGIGAFELDADTVRVYVNHELPSGNGYAYELANGTELVGSRISFFDIDKTTMSIVDGGLAYETVYDANGDIITDNSFTIGSADQAGFERFCSGSLFEANSFGADRGLTENIYFAGEETGGEFSGVAGAEWALDVDTGELWALPAFGRGAWENVTELDTGSTTHVAFILADDTSPFDADGDGMNESAPLYLYVGEKDTSPDANFVERNGLSDGQLFVWVPDDGNNDPESFSGQGTSSAGSWVEIDNSQNLAMASDDGSTGFDQYGYPTQSNLWTQAEAVGSFEFSRPEDVATNPDDGSEFVLASTGRQSDFNGADLVGEVYTMDVEFDFTGGTFNGASGSLNILYDGDSDAAQTLRSPDNLDWADDGLIYVQEDRAVGGIFGEGAVNPNDAGIVTLDPDAADADPVRIFNVDRSAVSPDGAVDEAPTDVGNWESSGILDVSTLFGREPGTLFLSDIQAHSLDDQDRFSVDGPAARLTDDDLVEGGQLLFLSAPGSDATVQSPVNPVAPSNGVVATYDSETGELIAEYEVGNLPDQVTFSKDGTRIFVANEGEPSDAGDAQGSISIIDLATGTVETFGFEGFDGDVDALREAGVRIFPGELPSRDFEPEYIAEGDNGKLYVGLQEANTVAVFDLATKTFEALLPLGTVDHSLPGNELDASDRDDAINIQTWPLSGLRMPDAIATAEIGGQTFFLTANEGDSRDFDEDRVADITLDPTAFPNAAELQMENNIGRIQISNIDGDTDGDGDFDQLFSFGSRGFTIFDANGAVVFDSGSQFETIIADIRPANAFNNDGFPSEDDLNTLDENRSDNKGPEPEAIAIGEVDGKILAFIGLERDSGIMVYDITVPGEATYVDYIDGSANGSFAPETIQFIPADESENGEAQIAVSYEVSGTTAIFDVTPEPFVLQLLHFGDPEAGLLASTTAPNLAALVDAFEEDFDNTLTISAGDNYIPGVFLSAGGVGVDIGILNAIGVDASAIGNHEFDLGEGGFSDAVNAANFPHITANLDFSNSSLADRFTDTTATDGLENLEDFAGQIVPNGVFELDGEQVGVVGATTQILATISSPGGVEVIGPQMDDMPALAAILQPVIDDLIAQGVNKIILVSHLQQLGNERELATLLNGVDIIIGGGSNTRLGDEDDVAVEFPGHAADFADTYPILTQGADGNDTLIVNTDNEYTYLGRLVVEFDDEGNIVLDSLDENVSINGAYASTEQNVADAFGVDIEDLEDTAFAEGTRGDAVRDIIAPIQEIIETRGSNIFGFTEVFLEGAREAVRTEETNLGNLTAEANIAALRASDDESANAAFVVSIKNGGGIRAAIGTLITNPDGTTTEAPPQQPVEGGVSQLDVENSLRFDNSLSALEVTAEGLKLLLEAGVRGVAPGATPGSFAQVAGVRFSYDPDGVAFVRDPDNPDNNNDGSRIQDVALIDEDGNVIAALFDDGVLVEGAPETITVVTLGFLASGGDGYPFPEVAQGDARDLGIAEQEAFENFLRSEFPNARRAFDDEETSIENDDRIQNLNVREDTVLTTGMTIPGGDGDDRLTGTERADDIRGGSGDDFISGRGGNDFVIAGTGDDQVLGGDGDDVLGGNAGNDTLAGGEGADTLIGADGMDSLIGSDGNDVINGGLGDDIASGGSGRDLLIGGSGDDRLIGNDGDDVIGGNGGMDDLAGGNGADTLLGGSGDDLLNGNAGNDVLRGGTGADRVTGGEGSDNFAIFNADESAVGAEDSILDFSSGEGDTIDLRGLNNEVADGGSLSFAGTAFSGTAGQVIVTDDGRVEVDLDGDSIADVAANVTADAPLMTADILI